MVKFSHSLQFNTVPDWASEYIAYSNLKKTLYAIERDHVQSSIHRGTSPDPEKGLLKTPNLHSLHGVSGIQIKSTPTNASASRSTPHAPELGISTTTDTTDEATRSPSTAHHGSDIFPPESAAFERALSKELVKIYSFYIRKELELSAELDAVERQWLLEESEQRGGESGQPIVEEKGQHLSRVSLEEYRRQSEVDEKEIRQMEKAQLKEMMHWDKDGLMDQEAVVVDLTGQQDVVATANGSSTLAEDHSQQGSRPTGVTGTVTLSEGPLSNAEGSEYNLKSDSRRSSHGDLTEIVWRRECLIESDEELGEDDHEKGMGKSVTKPKDGGKRGMVSLPEDHPPDNSHHRSTRSLKATLAPKRSVRDLVTGHHHPTHTQSNPHQKPSVYSPLTTEALLHRRLIDTYMLLSELKSYVALNYLGFQKIVKKHDKLARCTTLDRYMATVVDLSAPFQAESRQQLDAQILRLQAIYSRKCAHGSMALAARELRSHLREYIVWERNTVWRDMVGQERKAEGARAANPEKDEPWILFGYPIRFMSATDARHVILGLVAIILFALLMSVSIFDTREQNRCFAILITVAFMWATEVFPLFATALLVPLLTTLCQVMRDPVTKRTLSTSEATKVVFSAMFSPTIMLLLGGFTIASALSKYGIAKAIASTVLSKAGTDPKWVLLTNMFVATIASMFISNVAAPVLCFSLVQSILRTLPHKASFGPCLIMGIALASNVGGMASPISSPQNIIAIQNMTPAPSWGNWFAIALPVCIVIDLIIWAWLILLWRPQRDTPSLPTIRATREPITVQKVFICLVTLGTIILWCVENSFKAQLGDMGVIAILPLIAFFGTGLLNKEDFNNFLWTVIMLAMGGIALGKSVDSSGLLDTIAHSIQGAVSDLSLWVVLIIFSTLTLVFATFVSHTVAAVIILPIVQQVGLSFADPHPRILVMGTGLVCSAAMGLPVSGFPNMNAIALEDEMGIPYLRTKDFLKTGVPLSILATVVVVTMGYGIMSAIGF